MIHGGELWFMLGSLVCAAAAGWLMGWGPVHWSRDAADRVEPGGCGCSPVVADEGCCLLAGLLHIFADSWLTVLLMLASWVLAFFAWPVEGLFETWSVTVILFMLLFSPAFWVPVCSALLGFSIGRVLAVRRMG